MRFGSGYQGSSFSELLRVEHAHLAVDFSDLLRSNATLPSVPEATTVLVAKYADGVLVAGDRLATEGNRVASRDIDKVFPADEHSLIAISGAAGPCIEMARIMRVELEHYEKIEGEPLELEGKANKLSQMIRANLPAAMQGLVVIPLFAGYDPRRKTGRLWKYDVTGGRYEEADFEATGSGSLYARESLKKSHSPTATRDEALKVALQALMDAADEDRATGGVDARRGIYPIFIFCSAQGIERVPDEEVARVHREGEDARDQGASS